MKKHFIITAITMWAAFSLHAQVEFDGGEFFQVNLNDAWWNIRAVTAEADDLCRPSALRYATNLSMHRFDKPVAAPSFQPPWAGANLVFKVNRPHWTCGVDPDNIEFQVDNIPRLTVRGHDGTVVVNNPNTHDWSTALQVKVNNDVTKAFIVTNYTTSPPTDVFAIWGNGVVAAKKIYAEAFEVRANAMSIHWFDHVFEKDYKLMSLHELEQFIQANKHLPEIPSEKEIKENGFSLVDMQGKLLLKIEELTLYIIELEKRISELETKKGGE